jgi:dTDP-4-dehydrorhamnose 3,5-epimerase
MTGRFDVFETPLLGLHVIARKRAGDHRGAFQRLFCQEELQPLIRNRQIAQINLSQTAQRGTVRGMHFQYRPFAETKVVSCLRGEIFDVAVDLRRNSLTFLRWHAEVLSADNDRTLIIPEGFAHGFQTLADDCQLLYFHSAPYRGASEGGVHAQDPRLAIRWPLPVTQLSPRDAAHPLLTENFDGVAT